MQITISVENKVVLEAFKNEVKEIKQEATELSASILIQLKTFLFQFLLSYKEYSLTNIRSQGLTEILMNRALRFFRLNEEEKPAEKSKPKSNNNWTWKTVISKQSVRKQKGKTNSKIKNSSSYKYVLRKIGKSVLFPFYLLILMFEMLIKSKSKKNSNKKSRNIYTE